jgi:hypothetical protein
VVAVNKHYTVSSSIMIIIVSMGLLQSPLIQRNGRIITNIELRTVCSMVSCNSYSHVAAEIFETLEILTHDFVTVVSYDKW